MLSSRSRPGGAAAASLPQAQPPDQEAIIRLRLAAAVSLIAELILPVYQTALLSRPDWLTIEIQTIWFILTLALLGATWHPRFALIWKPAVLAFSAALILSSGTLSIKGASPAPFLFLLVLLPVGGTCLPWETQWQGGMSAICIIMGAALASRMDWRGSLVISGLSAMIASILGSHLINVVLTKQRDSIEAYLAALARSEAKFRQIFETSGSWIGIYSLPEGSVLDVNPAWEAIFGYARKDVLGRRLADLELWAASDALNGWLGSLALGNRGSTDNPTVFRAAGKPVHCLYSWSTLLLNDRPAVLVVGQDVTPLVSAEDELRRSREAMINQERLTAVGELASGIAHDLNNSLNALRLNLELLMADSNVSPGHRERLTMLSQIVSDANSTIGRLQDFARRRHDRPIKATDLGAVIRQAVEMVHTTLEEKSSLSGRRTRVALNLPDPPLIRGEPVELRQIFVNLLLNANAAMPRGGIIRIDGNVSDDAVIVKVKDQGVGIPPEHLARIFDPFFTTKGEQGTGLGLSIAYGVMGRLGGSITAANQPEGGAVFTLRFPTGSGEVTAKASPTFSAQVEPRRVLVIDDDCNNLQALTDFLQSRGHSVTAANSGPGALRELMRGNFAVDVVFCDLGLPDIDGWEIARRVKSRAAPPPTFYLFTGWAQEIRADDPRRRWVDAVVPKPVEPQLLDQLMASAKAKPEHSPSS